jgi:hypothetical protein
LQKFYIKLLGQPRCNFHRNWNFVWPTRRDLSFKRIHISLGIIHSRMSSYRENPRSQRKVQFRRETKFFFEYFWN